MTIDEIDEKIERLRSRAGSIARNLTLEIKEIEGNSLLSADGQREQLAEAKASARRELESMLDEERKLISDKRESLERQMIGSAGTDPTSVINFRDAQDRADKIGSSKDAERIMSRAVASGDKTLAAAVANVARTKGYRSVYRMFAEEYPANAALVDELARLDRYDGDTLNRAMVYKFPFV